MHLMVFLGRNIGVATLHQVSHVLYAGELSGIGLVSLPQILVGVTHLKGFE